MPKFENVNRLPRLAKYAFQERFAADPRPDKMLVSIGPYKNELGELPQYECVRIASERVRQKGLSKAYLDVAGYPPFQEAINRFLFGSDSALIRQGRILTTHTPGGTVALRIGADFIQSQWADISIWVSDPTWGNHIRVFETAGLTVKQYRYYDTERREFKIDGLLAAIEQIPDGDVIFLQGSTHNPTCLDPTPDEWTRLAKLVATKQLLPFFDIAFFGFSYGIREDLAGLMAFSEVIDDLMIALSFSKSFALYNDRIGAFSIIGSSKDAVLNVNSHIRPLIRANYSNPPLDGAAIITEILDTPELYNMWESEITQVRQRIATCRKQIEQGLRSNGVERDLSYMLREKGLFTTIDLSPVQIDELRKVHGIHISSIGRINVTSMTGPQINHFCRIVSRFME
jgi:aspartate/tyrosine/aromatic aminotransferase